MRVGILIPHPVGYRLAFFERVGQDPNIDLTVMFCGMDRGDRSPVPFSSHAQSFRSVSLAGGILTKSGSSGTPAYFNPSVLPLISPKRLDVLAIFGYSYPTALIATLAATARHIPWILVSTSHWGSARWSSGIRQRAKSIFIRRIVNSASALVVPGTPQEEFLLDHGAPRYALFQVRQSCDIASWREAVAGFRREAPSIRASLRVTAPMVVSSAGRLVPEKGLDALLLGFNKLRSQRDDWHLVIVGDGPQRPALQRLVEIHRIPNVTFTGALPPQGFQRVLTISDVFCLPSRRETWGIVVNEALASGVPVIVSERVGAAPDLVAGTGAGLVVPAGDPNAISTALRTLSENGDDLKRMKMATQQAIAPFTLEKSASDFAIACRFALSDRRGRGASRS